MWPEASFNFSETRLGCICSSIVSMRNHESIT